MMTPVSKFTDLSYPTSMLPGLVIQENGNQANSQPGPPVSGWLSGPVKRKGHTKRSQGIRDWVLSRRGEANLEVEGVEALE